MVDGMVATDKFRLARDPSGRKPSSKSAHLILRNEGTPTNVPGSTATNPTPGPTPRDSVPVSIPTDSSPLILNPARLIFLVYLHTRLAAVLLTHRKDNQR